MATRSWRAVLRALLGALALCAVSCDTADDDAPAGVPPGSTLVVESGPYRSSFGNIQIWSVGEVASDADASHLAVVSAHTTTTLTSHGNPFDPSDPTNYGGSGSGATAHVSVSTDGGTSWRTFDLPALAYYAHWYRHRLFLAFGSGPQSDWQYAIRELDPATGALQPALGAPFRQSYELVFDDDVVEIYQVVSGWTARYQLLSLETGEMHQGELVLPIDGCFTPHLRSGDRGYSYNGHARCDVVDSTHPSRIEPSFCHFVAHPRPVYAGRFDTAVLTPFALCVPLMQWLGAGDLPTPELTSAVQMGDAWMRLIPRDGRTIGVWHGEGGVVEWVDLGPGVVPSRVRFLAGLLPLERPDGTLRWLHRALDGSLWEVGVPQAPECQRLGQVCDRPVEKLVDLVPLSAPETPGEERDWLVFSRIDVGTDAHLDHLYVRRERLTMTPFEPQPIFVPDNAAPACTEPATSPTRVDNACATLVSCRTDGATSMSACVTAWLRADEEARRELVAGPVTCNSPWVYDAPAVGGFGAPCPRTGDMCVGDAVHHCGSSDTSGNVVSSYVTACGAAGRGCEALESAPHEPMRAQCTGGRGCPMREDDLRVGICQGDRLWFGAAGGARWVDCRALGLGTCGVSLEWGNARCVPDDAATRAPDR